VEQGTQFVTCDYCGTTNFVDKSGAVLHYAVRATVEEAGALAALRRWMAGNDTIKGLDSKAQVERPVFQLFPMWMVRVAKNDQEKVILEPAAALSVMELTDITIPASDLTAYDHALDSDAVTPTVPYETVSRWLAEQHGIGGNAVREISLVHLPLYFCKYTFNGRPYTAVVDAASSKVFASIYPAKWETPYFAIGAVGCLLYFCAALIPIISYSLSQGAGLVLGILIYLLAAVVLAIPIFGLATYVSAKV
jgi:hypothetical protein